MEKVRIIYNLDKTVRIITRSPKSKFSQEEGFNRTMKANGWDKLPYDNIDISKLPQSREYRNAWEGKKGKKITINEDKKKVIDRQKLIDDEKKIMQDEIAIERLKAKGKL